jgi:LacI family transcriptional regulator
MPRLANLNVVTVQDIARETGLSPSSVSAVLSGQHVKRRISSVTVERVQSAARRLHYVPNVTARSLRAKASGTKHVVLSILTSYEAPVLLVSQALRAMERAVARNTDSSISYTVNIELYHAGQLAQLPGLIDGHRCNGAIITNTLDADDQFLASAQLPFPVVLLGRHIPGYPGVSSQLEVMGRQAAEVLVRAGRHRLAVLRTPTFGQAPRRRFVSFMAAAQELTGIAPDIVMCNSLQEKAGFDAMQHYLKGAPGCDGLFAVTDSLAIGAYHAIKRAGRRIPEDIAAVGVGDNPASVFIDPPLTSFEVAEEAQNQAAVQMLLSLVNGGKPESLSVEVPVSLMLRESTGHRGT